MIMLTIMLEGKGVFLFLVVCPKYCQMYEYSSATRVTKQPSSVAWRLSVEFEI